MAGRPKWRSAMIAKIKRRDFYVARGSGVEELRMREQAVEYLSQNEKRTISESATNRTDFMVVTDFDRSKRRWKYRLCYGVCGSSAVRGNILVEVGEGE